MTATAAQERFYSGHHERRNNQDMGIPGQQESTAQQSSQNTACATTEERIYTWLDNLEHLAENHARAKARRVRLEHERQVVIAELQLEAEMQDAIKYKAAVAQEAYARRHQRYKKLLQELEQAIYIEEKSYRALQKRQWLFEAWRTEMSFNKAQIGRYGAVT